MNEWVSELMIEWVGEWMNEWVSELLIEWVGEWMTAHFFSLTEDGMLKIKSPIPEGVHKVLFW